MRLLPPRRGGKRRMNCKKEWGSSFTDSSDDKAFGDLRIGQVLCHQPQHLYRCLVAGIVVEDFNNVLTHGLDEEWMAMGDAHDLPRNLFVSLLFFSRCFRTSKQQSGTVTQQALSSITQVLDDVSGGLLPVHQSHRCACIDIGKIVVLAGNGLEKLLTRFVGL